MATSSEKVPEKSKMDLQRATALLPAIFILIQFSLFPCSAAATEKKLPNQDIVFLLDTSSSMRNIFGDVKKAILEYAQKAQPGDTIVLISFGEKINLRFRQKISSAQDIRLIERELASLESDQFYTYITGALDKGMEELSQLEKKDTKHQRTMILLSDGKNNPPPVVAEPIQFEDLLKRYPGLLQGSNAAFFYLSLGDHPDPDVVEWMELAKGTSFNLGKELAEMTEENRQLGFAQVFVEPVSLDLGRVAGPKATVPVSLAFFPARGDASDQQIQLSFRGAYQENPSWKTLLEITPGGVTCSRKPWTTQFVVRVDSFHEGTVVGKLELKPLPGQVLFLEPPEIPVTVTISQPEISVDLRERLQFGPIRPGAAFRETKSVFLRSNSIAEPEDIRITPSVGLPEGIKMTTSFVRQEDCLELQITVETDATLAITHSQTLDGKIAFAGARGPIKFSKDEVEIAVKIAPPHARGRLIEKFFSWLDPALLIGAAAGIVLLVGGIFLYRFIRARPMSALEGKLVLINLKDKSHDRSRLITASLNTLGKSVGRDSIVIGSAKDAGLVLPHKSVAAHHCELFVKLDKGNKRMYLQPLGKNKVIVNLQKLDGPVPLSDRDLIEVGAYTFRFENPHPYKQIVVRYLDGRMLKGTPASWDIEGDGFGLLPRDALPGSNEEIYVSFSDLKAVYFVRDFDGQIGKKIVSPATQMHGVHMLLTFHDKEKIEGYTSQAYSATSARFYFFPADQTGNTISLLVERKHLRKIDILEPAKEREPSRTGPATVPLIRTGKSA